MTTYSKPASHERMGDSAFNRGRIEIETESLPKQVFESRDRYNENYEKPTAVEKPL